MIKKSTNITVHIKYLETEQTFTGDPNQVWLLVNKFFSDMIPALQVIKSVLLTVDLNNLIKDCNKLIAVTPEGPVLLFSRKKLTDNETLKLHLVANFIAKSLGYSKNYPTKGELQTVIGKNSKITSTRLGELIREGFVKKTEDNHFKITTIGIKRFQKETIPEIRKRI